jgi:hypothetical protein
MEGEYARRKGGNLFLFSGAGEELTRTCREFWDRQPSGLAPEFVYFASGPPHITTRMPVTHSTPTNSTTRNVSVQYSPAPCVIQSGRSACDIGFGIEQVYDGSSIADNHTCPHPDTRSVHTALCVPLQARISSPAQITTSCAQKPSSPSSICTD